MKPSVSAIKENIKFVRDFMDKEKFTTYRRWESIYFLQTIKHLGIEEGVKFFEKLSKRKEMISAIKEDFD